MLKCSSERCVWAPQSLSAATLTSPRLSVSMRLAMEASSVWMAPALATAAPKRGAAEDRTLSQFGLFEHLALAVPDRDLIVGVLAAQAGFVTPAQVVEAAVGPAGAGS